MGEECPDIELLASYGEHKLTQNELAKIEAHLGRCFVCRQTVILNFRNRFLIEHPELPNAPDE